MFPALSFCHKKAKKAPRRWTLRLWLVFSQVFLLTAAFGIIEAVDHPDAVFLGGIAVHGEEKTHRAGRRSCRRQRSPACRASLMGAARSRGMTLVLRNPAPNCIIVYILSPRKLA